MDERIRGPIGDADLDGLRRPSSCSFGAAEQAVQLRDVTLVVAYRPAPTKGGAHGDGCLSQPRLQEVLLAAYRPCRNFVCPCKEMRWAPEAGHVPRGFAGATGDLDDVRLVLVCAEPGDPQPWERYDGSPHEEVLRATHDFTYASFRDGTDLFHRNVRLILTMCFPDRSFDDQLKQTWITESVLCSARVESGAVSSAAARACRMSYLERELDVLPNAVVVALGAKARDRLKGLKQEVFHAVAAAPPGCNGRDARPSWRAAAARVQGTV
jgi:uracil-DNA glycosylase